MGATKKDRRINTVLSVLFDELPQDRARHHDEPRL